MPSLRGTLEVQHETEPHQVLLWCGSQQISRLHGYSAWHRSQPGPDPVDNEYPACIRDVQRLTSRVAALSCFISRSSEKCHLFFSTLRKSKDFEWTPACEQALQDLKRYLTSPPLLSKPKDGEQLYIYLAVSEGAVSAVLVREEEGKQLPVY